MRRHDLRDNNALTPFNPKVVSEVREQAPLPGTLRGCRDCRWREGNLCAFRSFGERQLDVFTGKVNRVNLPTWQRMRLPENPCGPEARLWDKVPPQKNHRNYVTLGWMSMASAAYLFWQGSVLAFVPLALMFVFWVLAGVHASRGSSD